MSRLHNIPYSNMEYADMIFCYGEANGNATEAVRIYRSKFENSRNRLPGKKVIQRAWDRLRETG